MESIQDVLEANSLGRVAGQRLLSGLPLQLKLQARLKSFALLCVIAWGFWVSEKPACPAY